MDVLDAAYNVVHDYPGGADSLAPRLGKVGAVLSAEVRGNHIRAKLGLVDAVRITQMSGDLRILNEFAAAVDCVVVQLAPAPDDQSTDVLRTLGQVSKEFADLVTSVLDTTSDGLISDNELVRLHAARNDLIVRLQKLDAACTQMHDKSQGKSIRRPTA